MPSPIGHAIAGVVVARSLTPRLQPLLWLCALLAVAPDLDLLFDGQHRTTSHSVSAVALVTILAIALTGKVTRDSSTRARIVAACVLAYASHLLLDWLGTDPTPPRGLQLLWPFSDQWFISGWDLFRGTTRRGLSSSAALRLNATAILQEIAILLPVALGVVLLTRRRT